MFVVLAAFTIGTTVADVLVNGDFEESPFDVGWANSGAASVHAPIVSGSTQAARINAAGKTLGQTFAPLGADWTVEFSIACPDPALFAGANRAMNFHISGEGHLLNMRIAAGGAVQFYSGDWRTAGNGDEIKFSIDKNNDGDFSGADDVLNVHRIRISGRNYGTASANYDLYVSTANSQTLQPVATGLNWFQNAPVTAGRYVTAIIFRTDYGMVSGQTYVVDNCVVSRPGMVVVKETGSRTIVYEEGATQDTFTVALSSAPKSPVVVTLAQSADPPQITIEPRILNFTADNYDTPQIVMAAAIDDSLAERHLHCDSIMFSVSSSDPVYDGLIVPALLVTVVDNETPFSYPSFSGIYPHLAVTNRARECGIGAIVNWADSLWYVTYSPHEPGGSDDKLYQLSGDLSVVIRPESVGGTPANRMIHDESNQLIIGSHLIDSAGNVRTIPLSTMRGRMTANARHLTHPADKVYFVTMEEGIYEVDVKTLDVVTLHADRNTAGVSDLVPGVHGKGAYTGQGRLIISNNGAGGVLAEWDGTGDAGSASSWTIIDKNKYTDVTGPGGIHGNPTDQSAVWAIGWDHKSVLLNVCDDGGRWKRFRLPKASYTQDADHGWFTEWPRIRKAGDQWLMAMHCMFYDFPDNFSHGSTAGLRPIATHLKMVVDWEYVDGKLIWACNDASTFENPILGKDQSNLRFTSLEELRDLGRPCAWGGPWVKESVAADAPSEPFLVGGFDHRVVHFAHQAGTPVNFTMEIDAAGDNAWSTLATVRVDAAGYRYCILPRSLKAEWIRFRTDSGAPGATAYLHYDSDRQKLTPDDFQSLTAANRKDAFSAGILRPDGDDALTLQFAADVVEPDGSVSSAGYYKINKHMQFFEAAEPSTESWLRTAHKPKADFEVDSASVIVSSGGTRYRLPRGSAAFDKPTPLGWPRGIRELVTERTMMNIHGTFYEVPRNASGGMRKIRPITTHNRMIYDFCSWRGMLVLAGNLKDAAPDDHYVASADGRVGLWFGNVDDLYRMGIPRGQGGPWKDAEVQPETPSDPYLMTGYSHKTVRLCHDLDETVTFTLQVDFLAEDSWHDYSAIAVPAGRTVEHVFPDGYNAHWVRVKADKACTATAWFVYNPPLGGPHRPDDLARVAANWLGSECGYCGGGDLTSDGRVDICDLATMAVSWLQ